MPRFSVFFCASAALLTAYLGWSYAHADEVDVARIPAVEWQAR
ncbi:hypothetical protein LNAOJCKE_0982 [Methylorubrum aminovorans]|uniref:Uncharacterized protein n=1 Tax=Methylorubrum aminovorans TaxID=269069 RepID=A0ABQ4U9W8_9HYPH|nr:hypothetical protein [Methylorubrum aminovorans]GJE63784.1 hypothetical protein LNAOJCKE_0982 [Methylorubrum aminovorans]